jgi:hypothetical protein
VRLADVIRRLAEGGRGNVVKDVNAAVAANVGDAGSARVSSSRRRTRVVQHGGETHVHESEETTTEGRA